MKLDATSTAGNQWLRCTSGRQYSISEASVQAGAFEGSAFFPQEIDRFDVVRLNGERETTLSVSEGCFEQLLGFKGHKIAPRRAPDALDAYAGSGGRNS